MPQLNHEEHEEHEGNALIIGHFEQPAISSQLFSLVDFRSGMLRAGVILLVFWLFRLVFWVFCAGFGGFS